MRQGIIQIRRTETSYEAVIEGQSDFKNLEHIPRQAYYPILKDDGSCFMYDLVKYDTIVPVIRERGLGYFEFNSGKYKFIRKNPISTETVHSYGPVPYWVGQTPVNFTVDRETEYLLLYITGIKTLEEFVLFPNSVLVNINGELVPLSFTKLKEALNENT